MRDGVPALTALVIRLIAHVAPDRVRLAIGERNSQIWKRGYARLDGVCDASDVPYLRRASVYHPPRGSTEKGLVILSSHIDSLLNKPL